MKSQHKEQKIRTNCKDCSFAIYDSGNTQTGCHFDRITKFGNSVQEAYDNDKEFYIIDRLCTYYRDKCWGYTALDDKKVQKESAISFDIIFNCNNLNGTQAQIISNFINSNRYYDEKVNIILIHDYHNYTKVKSYVANIATSVVNKINVSICENVEKFVHQLVLKSKFGYHALVNHAELLETNSLHRLNSFVNDDLKKLAVANVNEIYFIGNVVYKLLYHTNNCAEYDLNVRTILNDSREKSMLIEI